MKLVVLNGYETLSNYFHPPTLTRWNTWSSICTSNEPAIRFHFWLIGHVFSFVFLRAEYRKIRSATKCLRSILQPYCALRCFQDQIFKRSTAPVPYQTFTWKLRLWMSWYDIQLSSSPAINLNKRPVGGDVFSCAVLVHSLFCCCRSLHLFLRRSCACFSHWQYK